MRLWRRIYRLLAGKCLGCGTKLTALELAMGYTNCLPCESRMNKE